MKFLLIALACAGSLAYADTSVVCTTADGSASLVYEMPMQTISIDKNYEAAPGPVAIVGESTWRPAINRSDAYGVFNYKLADGRSVDILWMSQETDVLRGIRPEPIQAVVKRGDRVIAAFPRCAWN
jgi:hypothetical protein